jgi:hypothetical protein
MEFKDTGQWLCVVTVNVLITEGSTSRVESHGGASSLLFQPFTVRTETQERKTWKLFSISRNASCTGSSSSLLTSLLPSSAFWNRLPNKPPLWRPLSQTGFLGTPAVLVPYVNDQESSGDSHMFLISVSVI